MEDILCNSCHRFFIVHDVNTLDCDVDGKPICPGCAAEESELREMDIDYEAKNEKDMT